MKKEINLKLISIIVIVALIGYIVVMMFTSMISFGDKTEGRQTSQIKDIIRKAAVQCYALEGAYPPNVDYLADNYGIILDKSKYFYYYDAFAENIMPDIDVISILGESTSDGYVNYDSPENDSDGGLGAGDIFKNLGDNGE